MLYDEFDQSVQGRMGGRGIAPGHLGDAAKVQVRGVEGVYDGGRKKNGKGLATTYMQDLRKRKEPKKASRF